MRTVPISLLLAVVPLALAACDQTDPPLAPGAASPAAGAAPAQHGWRGVEADFARIERETPGFGGYFIDDEGNLTAYVADPRGESTARAALERVAAALPAGARRPGGGIRVLRGRWSFNQLSRWRDQVSQVRSIPGVVFIDLNEAENRLTIGVESDAAGQAVLAHAAQVGIPSAAVAVTRAEPVRFMSSLRDVVRPVVGGLQFALVKNGQEETCTLGYPVVTSGGTPGWLVNSHCTANMGVVDYTRGHQPVASAYYDIGAEIIDPAFWPCHINLQCRYSDAAVGMWVSGASYQLGRVARTTARGTTSPGSLTIDALNPTFQVTGEQLSSIQGQTVEKVGRTTGWTGGVVNHSCVSVGPGGYWFECQTEVATAVAPGDSGSPVFVWGNGNTITAAGILWGGNSNAMYYSPLGQVESEVGNLTLY